MNNKEKLSLVKAAKLSWWDKLLSPGEVSDSMMEHGQTKPEWESMKQRMLGGTLLGGGLGWGAHRLFSDDPDEDESLSDEERASAKSKRNWMGALSGLGGAAVGGLAPYAYTMGGKINERRKERAADEEKWDAYSNERNAWNDSAEGKAEQAERRREMDERRRISSERNKKLYEESLKPPAEQPREEKITFTPDRSETNFEDLFDEVGDAVERRGIPKPDILDEL